MRNAFSDCHPVVNFTYFALVILLGMLVMHPVCMVISLISALAYSIYLKGRKAMGFAVRYMLPMAIIAAVINPAFSHEGVTILTYLRSGNPLTLESIIYGIAAAVMLVTVIFWFSCYNEIMTSDKFIYLFGRVIPALSLIFSMVLRFVPKFKAQIAVVSQAQRCVGRDVSNGSILQRARHGIRILSIMVTWSLENAIETADSMKSRGYGLPGRTAFSIFSWGTRDKIVIGVVGGCGLWVILGVWLKGIKWRYFPSLKGAPFGGFQLTVFLAYGALCLTPLILDIWEDRKWKISQSGI